MKHWFESKDAFGNNVYLIIAEYGDINMRDKTGMSFALSNEFSDVVRLEFEIEKALSIADWNTRGKAFLEVLNQAGSLAWGEMK
jgi:hypothetical protein